MSKLTIIEELALSHILNSVMDAIEWDQEMKEYSAGDRVIFSCSKEEYLALIRAYKKL